MSEYVLVDLLFMVLAMAVAWAAHYLAQPPPGEAVNQDGTPRPLLAAGQELVSWTGIPLEAPKPSTPLDQTLRRICFTSGYRGIDVFLDGARLAYEAIAGAFASGDLSAERHLLSDTVYEVFSDVIAQRKARGETIERIFIGLSCDIVDAGVTNGEAWIDVRFVETLVSATRNAAGAVIEGHPNRVVDIAEVWTFERNLRAPEPMWVLTATEEDE